MIIVCNNDSNIINRDDVIVELCKSMMSKEPITLQLNGEGPCAESLGLYDILDKLCAKFHYDQSWISIQTCNLIEQHPIYAIDIYPQMVYLESARRVIGQAAAKNKEFNDGFKHFANFIGHGNLHRLHLASQLQKRFKDKSLCSYHYKMNDEYHRIFVGIEDMMFLSYPINEIKESLEFLVTCPMTVDDIDEYPILNPATFNISKIYHKFFLEITNLTYFSGNTFYIDEKIWRPIIMRTPFMVQGPQNFLQRLRSLGFQTFDRWWDEGYSEDPGRWQVDGILNNLNVLSKYSIDDLACVYQEMQSVLDHNQKLAMSLDKKSFEIFK